MFGGVLQCTAVFFCVRLCTAVVLCVRRWSSEFGPDKKKETGETRECHSVPGVNDTWYNMRWRIVTFISSVYIFRARGISFSDVFRWIFASNSSLEYLKVVYRSKISTIT